MQYQNKTQSEAETNAIAATTPLHTRLKLESTHTPSDPFRCCKTCNITHQSVRQAQFWNLNTFSIAIEFCSFPPISLRCYPRFDSIKIILSRAQESAASPTSIYRRARRFASSALRIKLHLSKYGEFVFSPLDKHLRFGLASVSKRLSGMHSWSYMQALYRQKVLLSKAVVNNLWPSRDY